MAHQKQVLVGPVPAVMLLITLGHTRGVRRVLNELSNGWLVVQELLGSAKYVNIVTLDG
jgi:hypothetical protein